MLECGRLRKFCKMPAYLAIFVYRFSSPSSPEPFLFVRLAMLTSGFEVTIT
jgi:hypothetical protein